MIEFDRTLALIAAVVLVTGLYSNRFKRGLVQEPLLALLAGLAIGPFGLRLVAIQDWGPPALILEHAARLTLAFALMGVALRIDRDTWKSLGRPVAVLLTLGMLGMWLLTSALAWSTLGLGVTAALLLGAVLSPTDPVVASSIVTGPVADANLPARVRQTLSLESGANDGLAYILVLLPLAFIQYAPGAALTHWLVFDFLIGVIAAIAYGLAVGALAGYLLRRAHNAGWIEDFSALSYSIALSVFALGSAAIWGADALISVFVAGVMFNLLVDTEDQHAEERTQEAIAKLFTIPMFVLLGVALPLGAWWALGWPLLAFCVITLGLRRVPVLAALFPLLRPQLGRKDTAFLAWFGPIGIAALYYGALVWRETADPAIWHYTSAVIAASILVHGVTAAPLTRLYAKRGG